MKRKTILAFLTMCAVLGMSACGGNTTADKASESAEAQGDTEKGTDSEESAEEADTDETGEEKAQGSSENSRLVTVDKVEDYITIGQYKDLALERVVQQVTDDDVEGRIAYILQSTMEEVTDGAAQEDDRITIDFTGTMNGKAFDNGSAEDYEMILGSAGMIEGFESGIVGMKTGETKTLSLRFPEDYREESLAGQPVEFEITVKKILRTPSETPEFTDEWVAANSELATMDEYRSYVRTVLEQEAAQTAEQELYTNAWNMILENSEIKEYPEKDVNSALEESKRLYQDFADQAGMTLEEFVESQGYTMDEFDEQNLIYVQDKVKQNLIVQGIMDAEGLSLEDAESLAIQDEIIAAYGMKDLAQLVDTYGQVSVDETIGLVRVERFVVDHAQISEKAASGDLIGENADVPEEDEDSPEESSEETPEETDTASGTEEEMSEETAE